MPARLGWMIGMELPFQKNKAKTKYTNTYAKTGHVPSECELLHVCTACGQLNHHRTKVWMSAYPFFNHVFPFHSQLDCQL